MRNKIGKLFWVYSFFWQTYVPVKPKYGNHYSKGWTSRWRKSLKK